MTDTTHASQQTRTASIDGETLDAIEAELVERYEHRMDGQFNTAAEQAVTSSELADEITGEDAEANPKTREALKVLMRERDLPIVANNHGSWIPVHEDPVETKLEELDARIAGIEERKQLLSANWRRWTGDLDTSVSIPQAVRDELVDGAVSREDLVHRAAHESDEPAGEVRDVLDDLEANGFVYEHDGEVSLA